MFGCILTKSGVNASGYGVVRLGNKSQLEHRVMYASSRLLTIADIKGKIIMHTCDTPACINPAHLFLGTSRENTTDMIAKGRQVNVRGADVGRSKLTAADVLEIRANHLVAISLLAAKFNVTDSNIRSVLSRSSWKHL